MRGLRHREFKSLSPCYINIEVIEWDYNLVSVTPLIHQNIKLL